MRCPLFFSRRQPSSPLGHRLWTFPPLREACVFSSRRHQPASWPTARRFDSSACGRRDRPRPS
jgi:hypothetical protein